MRILFVCGSAEPGKSGVGDYTRKLASEFIKCGNTAVILSINERQVPFTYLETFQREELISVEVHRLSGKLDWKHRQVIVKKLVNEFNPDIVSLQFVPYSFHEKGIPLFLPSWLHGLKKKQQKWHVMFHELWIKNLKINLTKTVQKFIIRRLLTKLNFDFINTSTLYYQQMLQSIGYKSEVAPIFSNLPRSRQAGFSHNQHKEKNIVGILFGNIQENKQFIGRMVLLADKIKREMDMHFQVFHIGNAARGTTQYLLHELAKNETISVKNLGFLEPCTAAEIIAGAHIGLTNYRSDLINKSGSIAAMLYNGLPVVLLSPKYGNHRIEVPEISNLDDIRNIKDFIEQKKDFSSKYSAEYILKKIGATLCK